MSPRKSSIQSSESSTSVAEIIIQHVPELEQLAFRNGCLKP